MSHLSKFNEIPIHFVTCNVQGDKWLFKEGKYCRIVIENLKFYREKFKFKLLAYVIIPWHLHLLLQLSSIKDVLSERKALISVESLRPRQGTRATPEGTRATPEGTRATPEGTRATLPLGRLGSPDPSLIRASSIEKIMENFKKRVAREVIDQLKVENRYDLLDKFKLLVPRKRKHQYQIWQPDYYDFNIYTEKKLEEKINYLEITNPIKHKLVSHENIATYKYSSYRNRYLADDSLIKIDYLVI